MKRAFSLIELLITLVITIVVLATIYSSYILLFKKYVRETRKLSVSMSTILGSEILNQDLEHAGYGISIKAQNPPITFEKDISGRIKLILRSTYLVSDQSTKGWAILKCSSGNHPVPVSYSQWPLPSNYVVLMDLEENIVKPYTKLSSFICSTNEYFLAFPVPRITFKSKHESFVCLHPEQACAIVEYYLDKSNAVNPSCQDLFVLKRRVSWKLKNGKPNGKGKPFLDCVADFQIRIDWKNRKYIDPLDTRDPDYSEIHTDSFSDFRENLKLVHIYLLIRKGGKDPNYIYTGSTKIDNVKLHLPPNYKHYHWKVVKLSIKPINVIRK